nr:hypothetical protein [uncultured Undibacterium sp.]
MHDSFIAYVELGKTLASQKGLQWNLLLDENGYAKNGWNLTKIVNSLPPNFYLNNLGSERKVHHYLKTKYQSRFPPITHREVISEAWIDLIKAAVCEQLFVYKNKVSHIYNGVIRPLIALATCANTIEPYELNIEVVKEAIDAAKTIQPSGKLADLIIGVIGKIFDTNEISLLCPLKPNLNLSRLKVINDRTPAFAKAEKQQLKSLSDRKKAELLPEVKAFWELVRIVFTEKPNSYLDALRFALIRIIIVTGLRVGEVMLLPLDWKRDREYFDSKGVPAGESGGFSRAIYIRYFAEKQSVEYGENTALIEGSQFVPKIFEEILIETMEQLEQLTRPLRTTLVSQFKTNRILANYEKDELVPLTELYTIVSSNPFWLNIKKKERQAWIERYKESFDTKVLEELQSYQREQFTENGGRFSYAFYMYWNRIFDKNKKSDCGITFRTKDGKPCHEKRKNWGSLYLNVGELERYIKTELSTKLPDVQTYKTSSGVLKTPELMFLCPKRSLAEERNQGITDILNYFSVGIPDIQFIACSLGDSEHYEDTLFRKYGKEESDKNLKLHLHQLRHLLDAELDIREVSNLIITKHFGRKSVLQSSEYEHPSLDESLAKLPLSTLLDARKKSATGNTYELIIEGKSSGKIVDSFKKIQRELGDEKAFEFLKVEADGFQSTPYGTCITNLTVDPCAKHLECITGCKHLLATNTPETRKNLLSLEQRLFDGLTKARAQPPEAVGIQNQIEHAMTRLEGVRKLLVTEPGKHVFPSGADFSISNNRRSILDE